ncbi:histidine phosphatase family protein [Phaeobacter sp.]|uniref:histidine phosphatase family protein n=1 Tax=Phaeobacter sp. TaxID=1902409 RepID=UPI0025F806B3|nr:histidine phosphatase family protein [Phaeobacter sp.]
MRDLPKIWFLRHGETFWNAEKRLQGRLESDLTPTGQDQAAQQATLMAPILTAERPPCFASPLRRAQQTAQIALGDYGFVTDDRLAEVSAGVLEGMTLDEIAARHSELREANPHALDLFCEAPGGEGYEAFQARVLSVLEALETPTVLVAHGLWGQVARGIVRGLSRAEMAALPNGQGCVYVLENGEETVLQRA